MTTENIIIQIREDGSREVVRNLNSLGKGADAAQSSINELRGALAGLAGALAINELRKYADIWTQARGKINIFTHSAQETTQVMERLYRIAQDTRQPIEGMASSFHQLSIAGSALGASQQQLLTFTEAIGKALAVQGTDANTARGGIIQLGQAMNEGIVRAQEYNSMINAMPIVLKTVANNLEGVDGSLAKLRARMLEGKLYSRDFFDALLKGAPEISALFERSGKTIGQSMTLMRNAMIRYVGQVDEAYGVSEKFYDAARWGSENIDLLVKSLTAVASPYIVRSLWSVATALGAVGAAALANPFTALAAAVVATITALTLYRDEIILIQDEQVSLGDYMDATWELAKEGANDLVDYFKGDFINMLGLVREDFAKMGDTVSALVIEVANNVNTMVGTFIGFGKTIGIVAAGIGPAFKDAGIKAVNFFIDEFERGINSVIEMVNKLREQVGADPLGLVAFDRVKNESSGAASELGAAVQQAFKDSINVDYLGQLASVGGSALDSLTQKARELAKARHEAERAAGNNVIDLNGSMGSGEDFATSGKGGDKATKAAMRERERFLKSLRTESEQIEAEYQQRNALMLKYTEEGSAERELLQRRSNELRLTQERELYEKMTGIQQTDAQKLLETYEKRNQLILENTKAGSEAQENAFRKLAEQRLKDEQEYRTSQQRKLDTLYQGLLTEEEQIRQSWERRRQEVMLNTELTEQQRTDLLKRIEKTRNEELMAENGTFWEKYLLSAQKAMEDMDKMFESTVNNFSSRFGSAVESMVFDATSLKDAMSTLAEGMARSIINALGEMAAQWIAYKLVQLAVGKATQTSSMVSMVANAQAMSFTAGINAFAATAAIPYVGPALAPAAMAAALGVTAPMVAAVASAASAGLAGMAHSGIDSIPQEGTWLLDKGERVVDSRTNADLKNYLYGARRGGGGSSGGAAPSLTLVTNIHNNMPDQAAVSTRQGTDEDGNPTLEVMIDQIEGELAGRMASGRGPLVKATGQTFGLTKAAQG